MDGISAARLVMGVDDGSAEEVRSWLDGAGLMVIKMLRV